MGTMTSGQTFDTLSDLRSSIGIPNVQVFLLGLNSVTDNNGGMYRWDSTSVVADDGFKTIQVSGVSTGRWIKIGNNDMVRGTSTFSSISLTTAYVITHGLSFTPISVYIQAKSPNAAVNSWISALNATNFTVNFTSVPLLGTNNITIDWTAYKI